MNLLEIKGLRVSIEGREILHGVDLEIGYGETKVIFGPNGSGKTTLLSTIAGFSHYRVTEGEIIFKGQDITSLPMDERARLGIGLAFQRPPVVRGVKTRELVGTIIQKRGGTEDVGSLAQKANLGNFLDRDINLGFSGGEVKRSELLQLLAQRPDLVLLDEPESGVDLENVALIGSLINELLEKTHPIKNRTKSGLIISHTGYILDYVNADSGYVMYDGKIICQGNPIEILKSIKTMGYQGCLKCLKN